MKKGKLTCEKLKAIRKAIAEANGIEYVPFSCSNEEDCPGSCPQCDAELEQLTQLVEGLRKSGKNVTIPEIELEEKESELINKINDLSSIVPLTGIVAQNPLFGRRISKKNTKDKGGKQNS